MADVLFSGAMALRHLERACESDDLVDTYLLLVALLQLVEDHGPKPVQLLREARAHYDRKRPGRSMVRVVIERIDRIVGRVDRRDDMTVEAIREGIDACAKALVQNGRSVPQIARARIDQLATCWRLERPKVLDDVVRVPSCFRSFDQQPADLVRLGELYGKRLAQVPEAVAVVGLRTSGSYLAPLVAAALTLQWSINCTWSTTRPGWPVKRRTIRDVRRVATSSAGRLVIVDDPPNSGSSLVAATNMLRRAGGIEHGRIDFLLSSFSASLELPKALSQCGLVVLPISRWSVFDHLSPEHVHSLLVKALGEERAIGVVALGEVKVTSREHLSRRFRLQLAAKAGVAAEIEVVARGIGLGYYGRSQLATIELAPDLFAPVLAASEDLVIYRDDQAPLQPGALVAPHIEGLAANLSTRASGLRARHVPMASLAWRQCDWEVAARLVSKAFGPLASLAQLVLGPLTRTLLEVNAPVLLQGPEATTSWLSGANGLVVRPSPGEGPSSHFDLSSYDPVFDLAATAQWCDDFALGEALRAEYEVRTGKKVDPERWMLHRLIQAYHSWRLNKISEQQLARRNSAIVQRYFSERFLSDLTIPKDGPLCAVDLDGVLETSPLGYPSTSRAGALGLRALRAHGMRLLIVSGRSIAEVRERCLHYGALGGVAEYGAAQVLHGSLIERAAPAPTTVRALEQVRVNAASAQLTVDTDYHYIARVYDLRGGKRVGLDRKSEIDLGADRALRVVAGEEQSDFVPNEVTKKDGLERLLAALFELEGAPGTLAFGIGDTVEDAGFLSCCAHAYGPANAQQVLRSRVTTTKACYQKGFFEAVGDLLGHEPGSCEACAMPELTPKAAALAEALSSQEAGPIGAVIGLGKLALNSWLR